MMQQEIIKKISIVFILCLSLTCLVTISSAESVEIGGNILDSGNVSSIVWDGTNWSALYFGLNEVGSNAEILCYQNSDTANPGIGEASTNNVIDKKELLYKTHTYSKKFKLSAKTDATAVSTYSVIPRFGNKYVAVDGKASKMASLVTEQGGGSEKKLKEGEVWDLGEGYSLELFQLDADGGKAFVLLYKDGEELDSTVIKLDGTDDERSFIVKDDFADLEDAVYFVTYIDETFRCSSECFAIFKYTWLIDKDNVSTIEEGDKVGLLKCREVSDNWINMSNHEEISLEMNEKAYFTDDWYIRTSKSGKGSNGGYLFYPAMNVIFETAEEASIKSENVNNTDNEKENVTIVEELPSSPSSKSSDGTDDGMNTPLESTSEESETHQTDLESQKTRAAVPGFVSITAISGLVASLFVLKRRIY
jgi:S-layer protein (TIGR01567 family)